MDSEDLEEMKHCILQKCPNTYTLTKRWAEIMVFTEASSIPSGIFRPPIGKFNDKI